MKGFMNWTLSCSNINKDWCKYLCLWTRQDKTTFHYLHPAPEKLWNSREECPNKRHKFLDSMIYQEFEKFTKNWPFFKMEAKVEGMGQK